MLTLATPLWLILLPLPWLLWLMQRRQKQSTDSGPALLHPQAALLLQLQSELQPSRRQIPWLRLLGLSLLILALARPQWQLEDQPGRNFILALDVSGSMRALDFKINEQALSRLDILKGVVDRFLQQRTESGSRDRIGIVLFGDDAYTLTPMTTDLPLTRQMLSHVVHSIIGEKTALGDAVALGVKRLQAQERDARILILLTDGSHTSGTTLPAQALAMARHENVRIYSVGIGSHGKVLFPRGPMQAPDFKEVPMDETVLKQLAQGSGGRYYRASATEELKQIIDDIEHLETVAIESDPSQRREWFALPLLLGLTLIVIARLQHRGGVLS